MADKTVRYTEGQFVDPNIDSTKLTANNDLDFKSRDLANSVVYRQILNEAKSVVIQVSNRRMMRAGDASKTDVINKTIEGISSAGSISVGFKVGGLKGGIFAIGAEFVKSTLQFEEIQYQRAYSDAEAMENARRYGVPVDKRSENR